MTPGARIQAAIELLDEIFDGTPAEKAITGWARRSRFAGSKDRAAIRDYVYQALRCRRSYGCLGGAHTGRGVMVGALRAAGDDVDEYFSGEGHAPKPLTCQERAAGGTPTEPGDQMDLPDWVIPRFINSLGDEVQARKTASALQERASVMLRANLRKASVADAVAALAADGVMAQPAAIAQTALQVTQGSRRVALSRAYQDGLVELQDGASQAAMEMLELPGSARVLDYCAGGGGKVLALAARLEAAWFAHDALPRRMKDLPARAIRAGVNVALLDDADPRQPFDMVLCDVPCSGSGTWRRTPDAKWRLTADDLQALTRTQDGILDRAAELVAPGGRLVYATCSVLRDENEARIEAFLSRSSGWRMVSQQRWPVAETGDGFFLAQLQRA
ncbi:RsmB/NOP family class I SAM-dependent RNA methyltransferase [Roseovarius sp. CAU 1744]|uniref:RsmB/NOP family class I SAM-dependent RNA methyltransferase n=1 Tax=Roseovarius sp. CAU 1744 TaxID=3140368 RepID=UPI00325BBE40